VSPNVEKLQIFFKQISVKVVTAKRLLCFPGVHGLYLPASWSGKYTNFTGVQIRGSDPGHDVYPEILLLYLNLTL
jgi:hypothetical protein